MDGAHRLSFMKPTGKQRVTIVFRRFALAVFIIVVAALAADTFRHPNFWLTANQRGDLLSSHGKFLDAAKIYNDPLRIGTAQFRGGDFKAAMHTFGRVPGAKGAFNMGNAQVMLGLYDAAIASYDRALDAQPGWKEALDNKAIAIARRDKLKPNDKLREQEATNSDEDDDLTNRVVFDVKKGTHMPEPNKIEDDTAVSDGLLQASWLRRVQTTPGDFLRWKFAYQASMKSGGGDK